MSIDDDRHQEPSGWRPQGIDVSEPSCCCMMTMGKQGKHMSDTIELLEAIGRDASLRHASAEELTNMLAQAQAPEALTAAVASGDSSGLAEELGHKPMYSPQSSQTGHEEELDPDADEGPQQDPVPDDGEP